MYDEEVIISILGDEFNISRNEALSLLEGGEEWKKIIEKIKDIFSLHCPECGGRMKSEFLDMEIDHIVYKCEKCGNEWI